MPNTLLANVCNRSCPYCFARDAMVLGKREDRFISLDKVRRLIAWLKKAKAKSFSVIGGEPTLHPEFRAILQMAYDEGLDLFVFTNGLMSDESADFIASLPDQRVGALVNVNDREAYSPREHDRLMATLSRLKVKAALGFNIYSLDFDFRPLADTILEFGCKRMLRLGLAQPIIGGRNEFVPVKDYPRIAERLVDQAEAVDAKDVRVGFDCGFVMCMFTPEHLGRLTTCRAEMDFGCRPVVDIGIQLDAWACFPLTSWEKVRIEDHADVEAIQKHFRERQCLYRRSGIYARCFACRFGQRDQCAGGCLSHVITSFGHALAAAPTAEVPTA